MVRQRTRQRDVANRSSAGEARGQRGSGTPAVTNRPFGQARQLLAGLRMVEVESRERTGEIAATASAAPGLAGVPIRQPVELREVTGTGGDI